jgi:transcription initiation factor IIE alpha subunit
VGVLFKCAICGEVFFTKESAREHVKIKHPEKVREILSSLSSSSIVNLEKRGVDPENWATGYFIAFSQGEKSN